MGTCGHFGRVGFYIDGSKRPVDTPHPFATPHVGPCEIAKLVKRQAMGRNAIELRTGADLGGPGGKPGVSGPVDTWGGPGKGAD